jgi:hypothetical protein
MTTGVGLTDWQIWALRDPTGAGIDLAEDALKDSGLSARELLAEGLETWHIPPCLIGVREQILDAVESYLRGMQ